MNRAFYSDSIEHFTRTTPDEILGMLVRCSGFSVEQTQRDAWLEEVRILHPTVAPYQGSIYFEYSIPRMGRRIDVVLLIGPVLFVLEFKVGERAFTVQASDQVLDYALDLKNFHEPSHDCTVAPILIATNASECPPALQPAPHRHGLFLPVKTNAAGLANAIEAVLGCAAGAAIDRCQWESGRYCPAPTIIEAALALYRKHSVAEIARSDATAANLHQTSELVSSVMKAAKSQSRKAICFVTGVPGAGKTLVGLNIATTHIEKESDLYSVFLSGNGPLVAVLREALTRDTVRQARELGKKLKKGAVLSEVKTFIQNVHHFRDESLVDPNHPPVEHVAVFDEAQRAWDLKQTMSFMKRKKGNPNFNRSEPEFLISCLDRHRDWAVIVCLVGGGQEINTGEAGISEWFGVLQHSFPDWDIYVSPHLSESEYGATEALRRIQAHCNVVSKKELHLSVSMRSFRAENVSLLVKQLLDLAISDARKTLANIDRSYPILITRDLGKAKRWLKERALGTERYGILASSQAQRLKPSAINVKSFLDPIHWFLGPKQDVRSSYYLEDAATEFHVQGLELDWTCVMWDADFRYSAHDWKYSYFCGDRWNQIRKIDRRNYLKNAYRVLLTRARQGMVIVVPPGDAEDSTRLPDFYDPTFGYLADLGFAVL